MRWRDRREGDERARTLFAWIPIYIPNKDGHGTWVWLETVSIVERVFRFVNVKGGSALEWVVVREETEAAK